MAETVTISVRISNNYSHNAEEENEITADSNVRHNLSMKTCEKVKNRCKFVKTVPKNS